MYLVEGIRSSWRKNAFYEVGRKKKYQHTFDACMGHETIRENLTQAILNERELERKFPRALLRLLEQKRFFFVFAKLKDWSWKKLRNYWVYHNVP